MRKATYVIAIAILLSSCVSASVTELNPSKQYSTVLPEEVQVFLSEEDIKCDYEKVALINTKAGYNLKDEKSVKKARKKAGEVGANGIVLGGFDEPGAGKKVANAIFGTGANTKGEMVAIRFDQNKCNAKVAIE